ncbi:SERTA domain-containing protein 1 [Candoia aspera]|uniref:SERTA domain-containing protein 1 n=1 Tax=Candoia aspera TaxID=51853 RepID=UPI002FD7E312
MKRKRSEEAAEPAAATPCGSLFRLSVSKLHRSLQHGEPSLRHLVLVANTLRRFQGEVQPVPAPVLQATLGQEDPSPEGSSISLPSALVCALSEPSWTPLSPPSLSPRVDGLLLSSVDSSAFPTFLDNSSDITQPRGPQLCLFGPEAGTLELPSPGGYLPEDGLEGVFEGIDTSTYDCDLWLPTSLPNFKEAFCSPGEQRPDLAGLGSLMDVLVGVQEL